MFSASRALFFVRVDSTGRRCSHLAVHGSASPSLCVGIISRSHMVAWSAGPMDLSVVLPVSYALARPLLRTAVTADPSALPAGLCAAVALRRFEQSAQQSLESAAAPQDGGSSSTAYLRHAVACTLQLLSATALWVVAEWLTAAAAPSVAAWWAEATLQSCVGMAGATLTALAYALPSDGGGPGRLLARLRSAVEAGRLARRQAVARAAERKEKRDKAQSIVSLWKGRGSGSNGSAVAEDSGRDAAEAGSPFSPLSRTRSAVSSPLWSPPLLLDGGGGDGEAPSLRTQPSPPTRD